MFVGRFSRAGAALVLLFAFGLTAAAATGESDGRAARPPVPSFGMMLNDDGDRSFAKPTAEESIEHIQRLIRETFDGTPLRTLVYSIGSGSDILNYPTRVASQWGWRETSMDSHRRFRRRVEYGRAGAQAGVDPVRAAGEQAKSLGLYFVPSYRMNDPHFALGPQPPEDHPLTGEFWMANRDKVLGESPVVSWPDFAHLLDFRHAEVREHRLAVVREAMGRYADLMDGFELDFNRIQIFFPPGAAEAGMPLMTDLVRRVREDLDQLGEERGRTYSLFVRVPPSLRNCRWSGLDVEGWMRERLVDVVIPSQLMTLEQAMPVEEFIAVARPAGVKVYPTIYPIAAPWRWPFEPIAAAPDYGADAQRTVEPAMIRGAANVYRERGVDGFQVFNFPPPLRPELREALGALDREESGKPRIYHVAHTFFGDEEDGHQYRKQLPKQIAPAAPATVRLLVGEDVAASAESHPLHAELRIGLRGVSEDAVAEVWLSERQLHHGTLEGRLVRVTGSPNDRRGTAEAYAHLPIESLGIIERGENTVRIVLRDVEAEVVELQLGIFPRGR